MGHPEQDILAEQLFKSGVWTVGTHEVFASGDPANNKLDLEKSFVDPLDPDCIDIRPAIMPIFEVLCQNVARHKPDALSGPAVGGQKFALAVGRELDIPVLRNRKKPSDIVGVKDFEFVPNPEGDPDFSLLRSVVFVEDVTTRHTSTIGLYEGLSRDLGIELPLVAIEAIYRRDDGTFEQEPPANVGWVIDGYPIPNMLYANHPTYKKWGNSAKGEL